MTAEKEGCMCSETSEPSHVPCPTTDVSSTINSSELSDNSVKPGIAKTSEECKCKPNEKLNESLPKRSVPPSKSGQPPPANRQPQKGTSHPSSEFEPAAQCLCHAYRLKQFTLPEKYIQRNAERFNWIHRKKENGRKKDKLYEVKVKKKHYRHYSKPNWDDDGKEGIPKRKAQEFEKTEQDPKNVQKTEERDFEEITERIDIYYFDHGNSAYYRTTDSPPVLTTEKCSEKTDYAATRFWAEIFGTIHIGIAFVTAFILQFLRFLLYSIVRPLTVGILQLFADYFVKPVLSIFFNAIIQPILILLYNVATSFRDLCEPIAEAFGFFLREIAVLVRAFRIIEINRNENQTTAST